MIIQRHCLFNYRIITLNNKNCICVHKNKKLLCIGGNKMKDYKTILGYGEAEDVINKSKFIGYAKPVETEEEAQTFIEEIKKHHWKATHNVPVYILGLNNEVQRYSDDGEPSGTAGVPILNMLINEGITNIVVVVTRYYGGIKLGTGGLVRAYTHGAKIALEEAKVIDRVLKKQFSISMDYTLHGKVQNELMNGDYIVKDTIYTDKVEMIIYCSPKDEEKLISSVTNITNGKAEIIELDEVFISTYNGELI